MKYIWENPQIIKENKQDGHALALPQKTAESATERKASPFKISMNGEWKFLWKKGICEAPAGSTEKDFDDSSWETITVPGVWQLQKDYTKPYYYANSYPNCISTDKKKIPCIDHSAQEIGVHRTTVNVPKEWLGREIFLFFGAAKAGLEVFVNGKRVGYSQGSNTPHEFDVTEYITEGENQVTAVVYRYTDGTYLEDQDMWFFSGIYREVYLYSEPKVCLRDFYVTTDLINNYTDADLTVEMFLNDYSDAGNFAEVAAVLFKDGKDIPVGSSELITRAGENKLVFKKRVMSPALWSSEKPELYTLLFKITCGEEVTFKAVRIGFKQVEIVGEKILVNGQPLLIRGVNRHDYDPDYGWAVPGERYIQDLNIMKRANINAIRTSHYPNDPQFYDLCDEYGFWVMDECDLETHGVRRKGVPGDNPMWTKAVIDRMERMVLRDRNHACVFMWSLGNESGDGSNFLRMKEAAMRLDRTRQFHYEGDFDFTKSDVISRMYPNEKDFEKLGKREPITISAFDNIANALAADNKPIAKELYTKPVVLCEYAHAMENSLGNFQEYMDAFEKYENLAGGFIWDFVDQAIHKKDENGNDIWLYGTDYNEKKNWYVPPYNTCAITGSNTYFNANGIIAADRSVHPSIYEVKKVYAEMKVERKADAKDVYIVKNKQLFSDLSAFDLCYTVTNDGEVILSGEVEKEKYADTAPLSEKEFTLPVAIPESAKGEIIIIFSFKRREATRFCEKGYEQAFDQYILREALPEAKAEDTGKVNIEGTEKFFTVTGDGFVYTFENGMLSQLKKGDKGFLIKPFSPNFYRPLTDNDIDYLNFTPPLIFANPLFQWRRSTALAKSKAVLVHRYSHSAYIETQISVIGMKNVKICYTVHSDGRISVSYEGTALMDMLRFGLQFRMSGEYDNVKWYGRGPHETYCDRKTGGKFGVYEMKVEDLEHRYMRPQENGQRTDVRFLEITDNEKHGLRFTAKGGSPFCFGALRYSLEDLDKATHEHLLPHQNFTNLTLDLMQRGVGGDAPGSACLHEPYIMHKGKTYKLEFDIEVK